MLSARGCMRVQVAHLDSDLCRLCLGNLSAQMPSSLCSSTAEEGISGAGLAGCWEGPARPSRPPGMRQVLKRTRRHPGALRKRPCCLVWLRCLELAVLGTRRLAVTKLRFPVQSEEVGEQGLLCERTDWTSAAVPLFPLTEAGDSRRTCDRPHLPGGTGHWELVEPRDACGKCPTVWCPGRSHSLCTGDPELARPTREPSRCVGCCTLGLLRDPRGRATAGDLSCKVPMLGLVTWDFFPSFTIFKFLCVCKISRACFHSINQKQRHDFHP